MFPLMKGNANFHTSLNSICNVTEICGGKPYTIFAVGSKYIGSCIFPKEQCSIKNGMDLKAL